MSLSTMNIHQAGASSYPSYSNTGSDLLAISINDEIACIEEELSSSIPLQFSRIYNELSHAFKQKSSLLQRLNSLRASIGKVPPEVLIEIFKYGSYHDPRVMIRFGAVCSLWRQIIGSTPGLWVSSVLTLNVSPDTEISKALLLQLCLRNSGNRFLDLSIYFCFRSSPSTPIQLRRMQTEQPLQQILFNAKNAHRIRSLVLRDPPPIWLTNVIPFSMGFPNLERLVLKRTSDWITPVPGPLLLRTELFPKLRHLSVTNMKQSFSVYSIETITVLHLHQVPNHAVESLLHFPNLVECYCTGEVHDNTMLNVPKTYPFLEILTWPISPSRGNRSLLQNIRLPALKKLTLYGKYHQSHLPPHQRTVDALKTFLEYLPPSLTMITIISHSKGHWPEDALRQLLANSNLKVLNLDGHDGGPTLFTRAANK